ncbi:adenosylcobinamide-GDP ribazoletransferase [Wenjunlia tyrosinilytica]|uniref:Adenosylcobinamide-GDP ribazoletransferase n=1 Tax=Wenjunlia tyrosinilytica TaxID=1544741 RepID=A0A918DQ90_9ACTN|nr:adenosylcobinamide-GDP ribazoletransferase [Wenjunlia tyrosinilytica]GGO79767.1 adenosylcobinamide-GDP ribazoletransferase [Wenjunlia tyrosinilytica]
MSTVRLLTDGLRFAFGTLTILRVNVTRWDRTAARAGMLCAPLVGLVVGAAAAALGWAFLHFHGGPLLAAVAAVAVPAALTRGLHLDGLADTADGLGSDKPAEEALRIMKASDIGPFGVLTLLLVLLGQVAALARLFAEGWQAGAAGAVVVAVTARLSLTAACRTGVPPARRDGLGTAVAESVPLPAALAVAAVCLAASAALGGAADGLSAVHCVLAAVAGLAAGELLLLRCRHRLGGITGDVLGAAAETAATAAAVALSLS